MLYKPIGTFWRGRCLTKPKNKLLNEQTLNKNGVKVEVRTLEHGIPHGHVTGNGSKTTIGLDGNPMKSHPPLSSKQKKVIKENWKEVEDGIRKYFPKQSNR